MTRVVLIPAFDEAATLETVLEGAMAECDRLIVVNDGSTDDSAGILKRLAAGNPSLTVITHDVNRGMAAALRSGFFRIVHEMDQGKLDPKDALVLMDADGQHRPDEIPLLAEGIEREGLDLVIGRRDFSLYPLYKRFGNGVLSRWARLLTGFPFRDVECGFKALRVGALPDMLSFYRGKGYSCAQEIAVIAALLEMTLSNGPVVSVPRYRRGATVLDVFPVLWNSLGAWRRVRRGGGRDFRETPDFAEVRRSTE